MSCMVLDKCLVGPQQQESVKFPLTFFDIEFLQHMPMELVLLYQFPCSKTHFLETIVPNLKKSLSATLQHYLPYAGNIIFPPDLGKPEIQFQPGDSVEVTIAEWDSVSMMSYLAGNQPREVDKFYPLVSAIPGNVSGSRKVGLLALQLTLFPDAGISLGITFQRTAGDASALVGFLKAWSSTAKVPEGSEAEYDLPFHDRSAIKDPVTSLESGYSLSDHFWNQVKSNFKSGYTHKPTPRENSECVRATFVLSSKQIQDLKNVIQSLKPTLTHVSSYVVSCAYVWTCMTTLSEDEEEFEEEVIITPIEARARMALPVPATYFGNCIAPGKVAFKLPIHYSYRERLALCAEFIGEFIKAITDKGPEIFRDAHHWMDERWATPPTKTRFLRVAASPKFNFYEVDFGWGMLTKSEILCTDIRGNMTLCRSRGLDRGLEIAMAFPKAEMDAMSLFFYNGLEENGWAQTTLPRSSLSVNSMILLF